MVNHKRNENAVTVVGRFNCPVVNKSVTNKFMKVEIEQFLHVATAQQQLLLS